MRILLVASGYNSMAQRVHAEVADRGHEVSVELALGDEVLRDGVRRFDPDLVIAPMLTTAIPADIWSARPCLIVHPGPRGDRGPSSLDWAIMGGAGRWGVTVLQANAEMDAGDIWASAEFTMPGCSKSSVYRTEVADAAVRAVLLAVARFAAGRYRPSRWTTAAPMWPGSTVRRAGRPTAGSTGQPSPPARCWPSCGRPIPAPASWTRSATPSITWSAGTRKTTCAVHPGTILAQRDGAICRATTDGAVWIPQLRRRPAPGGPKTFKLPRHAGAARIAWTACPRPPHR